MNNLHSGVSLVGLAYCPYLVVKPFSCVVAVIDPKQLISGGVATTQIWVAWLPILLH